MSKILNVFIILLIAFILLFPNFVQAVDVNMNLSNTHSNSTSLNNTYSNTSLSSTNSITPPTNDSRKTYF